MALHASRVAELSAPDQAAGAKNPLPQGNLSRLRSEIPLVQAIGLAASHAEITNYACEDLSRPVSLDRFRLSGHSGQFVLGALLGVVWAPCTGPTLGAAVGLAVQGETMTKAGMIMATFGLGASTPILALAYGSRQAVVARRHLLSRFSRVGKPLMGMALVTVGVLVLTGLDKVIEASLTRTMPDWLVTVTTRL